MKRYLTVLYLFTTQFLLAQNIEIDAAHENTLFRMDSDTEGWRIPRMTTAERGRIPSPVAGLQIINKDDQCLDVFNGQHWIKNCGFRPQLTNTYENGITTDFDTYLEGLVWDKKNFKVSSADTLAHIGIGTKYPEANLDIKGSLKINGWYDQSLAPNGYARMGGILMQWGTSAYTSNGASAVTFPIPFTQTPVITAVVDAGTNSGSGANVPVKIVAVNTGSFQTAGTKVFSGDNVSKVRWMAIGF